MEHLKNKDVDRIVALTNAIPRGLGMTTIPSPEADAIVKQILSSGDVEQQSLYPALQGLTREKRSELLALMLLGRDWRGTFEEAVERAEEMPDEAQVGYISEKSPVLAKYLCKGQERLLKSDKPER